MRLIAWSLANRWLVLGITLLLCLLSGLLIDRMSVDVFPEFASPQVVIQTEAPGLNSTWVEKFVSNPIENALIGTPGVLRIRSNSSAGLSAITVVFSDETDIYRARQLISEKLADVATHLPTQVKTPTMVPLASVVGAVIKFAVTSQSISMLELRSLLDQKITPQLLSLPGVAAVQVIGGDLKQFQVELIPERLVAYQISPQEVRDALLKSNSNLVGAFLISNAEEFSVATDAKLMTIDDIKNTLITMRKGIAIAVGNVAEIKLGSAIKRGDAAFNTQPAIICTVLKAYGADTLKTTQLIENALHESIKTLPKGVTLNARAFRQADFIEAAIGNLAKALIEGAIIVIIIIFIFLMNWRASLITFIAMPLSFLGGILILYLLKAGINAMTLGGLAIAIGEVVDDAIITVENVVRHLQNYRATNMGITDKQSIMNMIYYAVYEIRSSVIYATLIIVLIFMPIFFLQGLAGRIFSPLGVAYIASVLASLLVAMTVIPALCYWLLTSQQEKKATTTTLTLASVSLTVDQHHDEVMWVRKMKKYFATILQQALGRTRLIMVVAMGSLLATLALLPFFGWSFLPQFHEGDYVIAMTTLPGTSLNESVRLGDQVRALLLKHPQVVSVTQRAGRAPLDDDAQSPNFSELDLHLDFNKDPAVSADQLLITLRQELAQIPGVAFNIKQFIADRMDDVLTGVRSQVTINIFGDNLDKLEQLARLAQADIKRIPGVVDIDQDEQIMVPQVMINLNRNKALQLGMNMGDVMADLQYLLNGEVITQIIEGRQQVDVLLRLQQEKSEQDVMSKLNNLLITITNPETNKKIFIPLRSIATIAKQAQPFVISHENAQRLTTIAFNVQGRDLNTVVKAVKTQIDNNLPLPPGYYVQYGGQFVSAREANHTLIIFGIIVLALSVLLLHKLFGNFRDALIVLANLPLALIGGVIALFVAGGTWSVASTIGFITLFGIAARNGIILLTHYQVLKKNISDPLPRVIQGTLDRLVPVLMTAITAALGLLPLLFGSAVGKELQRPLAQVVLGGLFTSTILNLLVIPSIYLWFEQRSANDKVQETK
jgi:CzcA family heavy metal efflux pump